MNSQRNSTERYSNIISPSSELLTIRNQEQIRNSIIVVRNSEKHRNHLAKIFPIEPEPVSALTASRSSYCLGEKKTLQISTGQLRAVGSEWCIFQLYHCVLSFLYESYKRCFSGRWLSLQYCFYFSGLAGNIGITIYGFSVYMSHEEYYKLIFFFFNLIFAIPLLTLLYYYIFPPQSEATEDYSSITMFFVGNFLYILFGFCVAIMLIDINNSASIAQFCLSSISCIFSCIACVYLASSSAVIAGVALIELAVRIVSKNLSCPLYVPVTKEYDYQVFKFTSGIYDTDHCVICLSCLNEGESLVILECHASHVFHEECLLEWIKKQFQCPVCRSPIQFFTIQKIAA